MILLLEQQMKRFLFYCCGSKIFKMKWKQKIAKFRLTVYKKVTGHL